MGQAKLIGGPILGKNSTIIDNKMFKTPNYFNKPDH